MRATESAVIVPIPEAEPVVSELRAELDRAAVWGVPAHVTVLYPFLPPDQVGREDVERLGDAVRGVQRFEVTFRHVRWFGDDVVWLAPDPDDGFRALTAAVWSAFPQYPPYAGAFGDLVPHLTVGAHADLDRMRAAGHAVSARLPLTAPVCSVHLLHGGDAPGAWRSVVELPLG